MGGILHYSAKIHFVFVKVVVKKLDKEMCNLFLDIIFFAILLIFMVLLMILLDTAQTMYYVVDLVLVKGVSKQLHIS